MKTVIHWQFGSDAIFLKAGRMAGTVSRACRQVPAWPPAPRPPSHDVKTKPTPDLLLLIGKIVCRNDVLDRSNVLRVLFTLV